MIKKIKKLNGSQVNNSMNQYKKKINIAQQKLCKQNH